MLSHGCHPPALTHSLTPSLTHSLTHSLPHGTVAERHKRAFYELGNSVLERFLKGFERGFKNGLNTKTAVNVRKYPGEVENAPTQCLCHLNQLAHRLWRCRHVNHFAPRTAPAPRVDSLELFDGLFDGLLKVSVRLSGGVVWLLVVDCLVCWLAGWGESVTLPYQHNDCDLIATLCRALNVRRGRRVVDNYSRMRDSPETSLYLLRYHSTNSKPKAKT